MTSGPAHPWAHPGNLRLQSHLVTQYHQTAPSMLEELRTASNLLDLATMQYRHACSAIQKACVTGAARENFPRELLISRLNNEMNLILDYVSRLYDSKLSVLSSRNHPINACASALPPEILVHIFRQVLTGDKCLNPETPQLLSKYPKLISHVCSSWRQAAIGACDLWAHIDISTCPRLIPRANVYALRSGRLPLFLHVLSSYIQPSHRWDDMYESSVAFIASVAVRAMSLHFNIDRRDGDFEGLALKACLESSTPRLLTHLTLSNLVRDPPQFLLAEEEELPRDALEGSALHLDTPKQRLENTMLGLITFRSGGIYSLWNSKAYHGLTDLSLGISGQITESSFVGILNSSPRLRSLEISLIITDIIPLTSSVDPVHLVDLERLKVRVEFRLGSNIGFHLRWIAPGVKALRLMLTFGPLRHPSLELLFQDQVRTFALRSNTTKVLLSIYHGEHYSLLADIFGTANRIKELAIECLDRSTSVGIDGLWNMKSRLHLDTLYLFGRHPEFRLTDLQKFIEAQRIQNIILWGCDISQPSKHFLLQEIVSEDEFVRLFPTARFLSDHEGEFSPVKDR